MKTHIAAFASVTHANKARAVLNRYGYQAQIRRTPASLSGGCGYSVTANIPAERLRLILEENGISYKSISELRQR